MLPTLAPVLGIVKEKAGNNVVTAFLKKHNTVQSKFAIFPRDDPRIPTEF